MLNQQRPQQVVSADGGQFVKNRDKLIKLLRDAQQMIKIPPQYANMVNFKSYEKQLMKELPKYRDKLPEIVKEATDILEEGTEGYIQAFQSIMHVTDYLGKELKISGIQIGIFQGMLQTILQDAYYQQNLQGIITKIVADLKA